MNQYATGDRVRIDIPDTTDPDHTQWHGCEGVIQQVKHDDAAEETGRETDSTEYYVEISDTDSMWFRERDLRPPFERG